MTDKKPYIAKLIEPKTEQTLIDLGYEILDDVIGEFSQDGFISLSLTDDEHTSIQEHVSNLQNMPFDNSFEDVEDYI